MLASIENAQKLNKLSGWKYDHINSYTAGYLLRKLPPSLDVRQGNWFELYNDSGDHWDAGYEYATSEPETSGYYQHADTPEDALALLCIRLIEEGILKHD